MYSLDINLLRERSEYATVDTIGLASNTIAEPDKYGKLPLFIGIGAAALALIVVGGGLLWSNQYSAQLEVKQRDLDVHLGSLKAQDVRLAQLTSQFSQVSEEIQSLSSVFNQVQPWSAVLQDLRENIPKGVQISSVTQTEFKPVAPVVLAIPAGGQQNGGLIAKISTPPNPEASSIFRADSATSTLPIDVATSKLEITGKAKSFEEVNNFMLTLKQSVFLNSEQTHLVSANLVEGSALPVIDTQVTKTNNSRQLELSKTVAYTIQTSLKRVPAIELMSELERKGAVGLVTRLKSLQQYQVVKP